MTPEAIIHAVCETFGITKEELSGPRKTRSVADARKCYAWFMRRYTRKSDKEIASLIGRNRSTSLWGHHRWAELLKTDRKANDLNLRVINKLGAGT